jgi:hypothetical protein
MRGTRGEMPEHDPETGEILSDQPVFDKTKFAAHDKPSA